MIVQMDKMSAPSRERVQRLYDKNIELENKRRRSAQARIPSDPNAWQQMRENYEAIILEDHAFSEQHNVEYALWQLHYRRIEELRGHFSAALASTNPNTSQGVKGPTRPDRITKIRLQFKTFLSEATGFYHDLIVKIRVKYGLPLGYFSEDSENRIVTEKDGKKSTDTKKGLMSCHRCLIYLGDLARYKGLYGEGDSKAREYAAASSYYLQAASLWPSSGNPHHQLAILASYSGDELVAVYRYFRSLAVDSPFSTARDNLIVAFEKNRHSFSQLTGDVKASVVKESPTRLNAKGRGKGEAKLPSKDISTEVNLVKEKASSMQEMYKAFCLRFVRLNGILFTRTSLETFAEVLSMVSSGLCELLSSGPEEEHNFGADSVDNGLVIVRLISILIFTVHNVNRETEGQTYAEIVQRAFLLQNSFTAVFELMGHILERCVQLIDPSSSFLLPGILVFVEWLACCPDFAVGSDVDEKQGIVRSKFWNHCISLLNNILSTGAMSIDGDEDVTCFYNMSRYEEGETENRLALWEDLELRGFLPLLPAQTILDFSRKHSFRGDHTKEKKARVKRILAAGKALVNVVRVDQKTIYFDSKVKKFVVGVDPQISNDFMQTPGSDIVGTNGMVHENEAEKTIDLGIVQPNPQVYMEEEEEEEIVFKPLVTDKRDDVISSKWSPYEGSESGQNGPTSDLQYYGSTVVAPFNNLVQRTVFDASSQTPVSVGNIVTQHVQPIQSDTSKWLVEEEASFANSLTGLGLLRNGHVLKPEMKEDMGIPRPGALLNPIQHSVGNPIQHSVGNPIQHVGNPIQHSAGNPIQHSVGNPIQPSVRNPIQQSVGNPIQQSVGVNSSGMFYKEEASLANSLMGLGLWENGRVLKPETQEDKGISLPTALSNPIQQSVGFNSSGMFYNRTKAPEVVIPFKVDAIPSSRVDADSLSVKTSMALPANLRKNPVSRPVRHLGPPPGFSHVPPKQANEAISGSDLVSEGPLMDDYSWLDGYQLPSSTKGSGFNSSTNYTYHANPQYISNSNGLTGTINFPFPGKQVPTPQFQAEKQNGWQDYKPLDHLKLPHEQQLQHQPQPQPLPQQQFINVNQQFTPLPEQYPGQSVWKGRNFV